MLDSDSDGEEKDEKVVEVKKDEPSVKEEQVLQPADESSATVEVAPEQSQAFNGFDYQASDAGEAKDVGAQSDCATSEK